MSEYELRLGNLGVMAYSLENYRSVNPFVHGDTAEFYNMFETYLLEVTQVNTDNQKELLKMKYMSSMLSDRNSCNQQIVQADSSISTCDTNISLCTVTAKVAGIVHSDFDLQQGLFIQAGTKICNISPYSDKVIEVVLSP